MPLPPRETLLFFFAWVLAVGHVLRRHIAPGEPVTPLAPLLLPVYLVFYTVLVHALFAVAHMEWETRQRAKAAAPSDLGARRRAKFAHLVFDDPLSDFLTGHLAVLLLGLPLALAAGLRMKAGLREGGAQRGEGRTLATLRTDFARFALVHLVVSLLALNVAAGVRRRARG